mmetsp:Transcript_14295/g.46650  ORF Transcript_14295/g.46650 Transcript_14295/m.46650 type:complete len:222 (+) Transcript_14295:384-1049(+)
MARRRRRARWSDPRLVEARLFAGLLAGPRVRGVQASKRRRLLFLRPRPRRRLVVIADHGDLRSRVGSVPPEKEPLPRAPRGALRRVVVPSAAPRGRPPAPLRLRRRRPRRSPQAPPRVDGAVLGRRRRADVAHAASGRRHQSPQARRRPPRLSKKRPRPRLPRGPPPRRPPGPPGAPGRPETTDDTHDGLLDRPQHPTPLPTRHPRGLRRHVPQQTRGNTN